MSDSTLKSTWTAPHGNYDLMHYIVIWYLDIGNLTRIEIETAQIPYAVYTPSRPGKVWVTVSAFTECSQLGDVRSSKIVNNTNKG